MLCVRETITQINITTIMSLQSVLQYLPNPLPSPLSKSCNPYLTLKADEHGEVLPVIANDNTVTQQGQLFLHFLKVKRQTRYRLSCVWVSLCALSAVQVHYSIILTSSIRTGATFSPPLVIISSFRRPVIFR